MTREKLKNQILIEIRDENKGKTVSEVADNFGIILTLEQIKAIEVELYMDGLISTTKTHNGIKELYLTEKGLEFISNGGYKTQAEQAVQIMASSMLEKSSKTHQDRKKPHEIKIIYQKLKVVCDD